MATYFVHGTDPDADYVDFTTMIADILSLGENDVVDGMGGVFRELWSANGVDGVVFRNATVYGSDEIKDDSWTNTTGWEYSHALTTEPQTVFIFVGGQVIRLWKGTAAGSLGIDEWFWVGGVLHINIGVDPNGTSIEVGARDNCAAFTNCDTPTTKNFSAYGANSDCIYHQSCVSLRSFDSRCWCSGGDGFKGVTTNPDVLVSGLDARHNGLTYIEGGGPGDGLSFHGSSNGKIVNSYFEGNAKAGIANVETAYHDIERNVFRNNEAAVNSGQSGTTKITIRNNIVYMDWNRSAGSLQAFFSSDPVVVDYLHNTIIGATNDVAATRAVRQTGGYVTFRDNLVVNARYGVYPAAAAAGDQEGDHNCFHNVDTPYHANASGCSQVGDVSADPDLWAEDCPISMNFDLMAAASDGSDIGAYYVDAPDIARPVACRPVTCEPVRCVPVRCGPWA